MTRELRDYLNDIVDAMAKALKFVEGMSYEDFVNDDKTVFAVVRALEVVGEAVKNIPEDFREKYPHIPWKDLAGMRDKLIHGYFGVDLGRVWRTVKEVIPAMKPRFDEIAQVGGQKP